MSVTRAIDVVEVDPLVPELPSPEEMAYYRSIDVNEDGTMSPLDLLNIVAHINQQATAQGASPSPMAPKASQRSPLDVNRDDRVSPLDLLTVINDLNTNGSRKLPRYVATPTSLGNGLLLIEGTQDADEVHIATSEDEIVVRTRTAEITRTHRFQQADVTDIVFAGYGGDDRFTNETAISSVAFGSGADVVTTTHWDAAGQSMPVETPVSFDLTVEGIPGRLQDLDVVLDVLLDGESNDAQIDLISPNGTRATLYTNIGKWWSPPVTIHETLDDEASYALVVRPYSRGNLRAFDGEDPNGTWTLEVYEPMLCLPSDPPQCSDPPTWQVDLQGWSLRMTAVDERIRMMATDVANAKPM